MYTGSSEKLAGSSQPALRVSGAATLCRPVQPIWTTLDSLLEVDFRGRPVPLGCRAPPALCTMNDVFDEILVISLPRFKERHERMRAQLDALGARYTLIQARDARSAGTAELAMSFIERESERRPSVMSLYLTQVALLQYFLASPMQSILILEDDVLFRADFPKAFDRFARGLPGAWGAAWLGINTVAGYFEEEPAPPIHWKGAGDGTEGATGGAAHYRPQLPPDLDSLPQHYRHAGFYGAFAIALQRDAAYDMQRVMLRNRTIIDTEPYIQLVQRGQGSANSQGPVVANPPLAIMDIGIESTLNHYIVKNISHWNLVNGIDYQWFDARRGYHAAGEAGKALLCKGVAGWDRTGGDLSVLHTPSAAQCCEACTRSWPACKAWSWGPGTKTCWLKYMVAEPVKSEEGWMSGVME